MTYISCWLMQPIAEGCATRLQVIAIGALWIIALAYAWTSLRETRQIWKEESEGGDGQ